MVFALRAAPERRQRRLRVLEERYFWKAGVEKTCDISVDTTGLFEG